MGGTTAVHGLPFPAGSDAASGLAAYFENLADALEVALPVVATSAPAAPQNGTVWFNPSPGTDSQVQIWDGAEWQPVTPSDTGWINITSFGASWGIPTGHVAQMRQIGNQVFSRGTLQSTTATSGTVFNLPAGILPPNASGDGPTVACGGSNSVFRSLTLAAGGTAVTYSAGATTAAFLSLAPLTYLTD